MAETSLFEQCITVAGGISVFRKREEREPSIQELSDFLLIPVEKVIHLCNRMEKYGIIGQARTPFGDRVFIKDIMGFTLLIEAESEISAAREIMRKEIEKQSKVDNMERMLSEGEKEKKKKKRFNKLEELLKDPSKRKKTNPLDALFIDESESD
jgi:hypothetical protein